MDIGWRRHLRLALWPIFHGRLRTRSIRFAALLSVLLFGLGRLAASPAVLPLGGIVQAAIASSTSDRLYVALVGDPVLHVVAADGTDLGALPFSAPPVALALDPASDRLWVATLAGYLVLVDGRVLLPLAEATIDPPAESLAVDASHDRLYVLHRASGSLEAPTVLSVRGARSLEPLESLPMGPGSAAIAADERTGRAYVAASGLDALLVIQEGKVVATLAVGRRPVALAVEPDTGDVYIANAGNATVSVVDGVHLTVRSTLSLASPPTAIALNPDSGHVVVALPGQSQVAILGGGAASVRALVPTPAATRLLVPVPGAGRVYVATDGPEPLVPVPDGRLSFAHLPWSPADPTPCRNPSRPVQQCLMTRTTGAGPGLRMTRPTAPLPAARTVLRTVSGAASAGPQRVEMGE